MPGGDWDAVVKQYEKRRPSKVSKWQGKWHDVIRNQPGHMFTFSPYDRSIRPQSKAPPTLVPSLSTASCECLPPAVSEVLWILSDAALH